MTKYHFNEVTGRANICRAVNKCPLGVETPHFDSKMEVKVYIENEAAEKNEKFTKLTKNMESSKASLNAFKESYDDLNEYIEAEREYLKTLEAKNTENNITIRNSFSGLQWGDEKLLKYNENYSKVKDKATDDELEAIKKYTALKYMIINRYLNDPEGEEKKIRSRAGFFSDHNELENFISEQKETIKNIDSFIAKTPKEDKVVYRYMNQMYDNGEEYTFPIASEEWVNNILNYKVGETVTFRSYLSTTIDPAFIARKLSDKDEHTGVAFVISTSDGAAVGVTALSDEENTFTQATEREVLLPRGKSFKINRVERARFINRDGEIVAPITVFLSEVN